MNERRPHDEKQIFPFYCKFNDKAGKEQRVGVEISKGHKKLTDSYADQEGRGVARFFNTPMAEETQIRYTTEPQPKPSRCTCR